MKTKVIPIVSLAILLATTPSHAQEDGLHAEYRHLNREAISVAELVQWDFLGMGKAFDAGGGQFCLTEDDVTAGVMIISPGSYPGDVVIRYKTFALTSASVLVVMHSVADPGPGLQLNIPEDYDGSMGLWMTEKENYFVAFRNASHGFTPFIRKYPEPGNEALGSAWKNFMLPGKYYEIEVGRTGNRLWLSVDGETIVETRDSAVLPGGHIAFRIRGTAGFKAACLIKDLEIYSQIDR